MPPIFETDIDFQAYGIEVISDAYKFTLPVPNLQAELTIQNYTDQSSQSVAVDGTGIIIFNFSSKEDAESASPRIVQLINEQLVNKEIHALTAQHIRTIIGKARTQVRHNGNCRLVQTDVFLKTYKNKDHSKIQESELERNQILVSQLSLRKT